MQAFRCDRCTLLSFDQLQGEGFTLFSDVRELQASASAPKQACDLCSIFWWSLRHETRKLSREKGRDDAWNVRLYRNPPNGRCQRVDILAMPKEVGHDFLWAPGEDGLYHLGPPDDKDWIARGHLTVYVDHGNPKAKDFVFCRPEADPASIICLNLVYKWLMNCMLDHWSNCPMNTDSLLPTRLIEIDSIDGIIHTKLTTTSEIDRGAYLALSYCWGKGQFLRLTAANQADLHNEIPFQDLPRTIRDSIILTNHIGFRYLWVDALCIIQGNDKVALQDWDRESKAMHKVFGGAALTIRASAADNADGGLFHDRSPPKVPYTKFSSPCKDVESIYLGAEVSQISSSRNPLAQRGWAFQEAVLSNRIISYVGSEMQWKCHSCRHRESYANDLELDEDPTTVISKDDLSGKLYKNWTVLVEKYSEKELTFMKDKLIAIDGLASLVTNQTDQMCHFGIWQDQFRRQLLWKHVGRTVEGKVQYSRQKGFRAPSWSWASVDGGVRFLHLKCGHTENGFKSRTFPPSGNRRSNSIITKQKLWVSNIKDGMRAIFQASNSQPCREQTPEQGRNGNIVWIDSTSRASCFCVRAISNTAILVEGRLDKIRTLRYETRGKYYGAYETYFPWIYLNSSIETFIDDLDKVPEVNRKISGGDPKELVNAWFLFVGDAQGLILVEDAETAPSFTSVLGKGKPFRRIGAFVGYKDSKKNSLSSERLAIEIV